MALLLENAILRILRVRLEPIIQVLPTLKSQDDDELLGQKCDLPSKSVFTKLCFCRQLCHQLYSMSLTYNALSKEQRLQEGIGESRLENKLIRPVSEIQEKHSTETDWLWVLQADGGTLMYSAIQLWLFCGMEATMISAVNIQMVFQNR